MIKKIFFAMVFLGNTLLLAQTGTLEGKVVDHAEELSFANIRLTGDSGRVYNTVAAFDGTYRIKDVPYGDYTLKTCYIGYKTKEEKITIGQERVTRNTEMDGEALMVIICGVSEYSEPVICATGCVFQICSLGCIFETEPVEEAQPDSIHKADSVPVPSVSCIAYPNPFNSYAVFCISSAKDPKHNQLQLFDLSGNEVRREAFSGTQFTLDRQGLAAGAYVYRVSSDEKILSEGKIVVQ